MGKLNSISRSQRFRLACSSGAIFLLVAQFLRSGSLWWGGVFASVAAFLYFRQTANMLSALPIFVGAVLLPFFFPHGLGTGLASLFSVFVALLFGVALGVKNLVLIHRDELLGVGAYVMSYAALILFFMQAMSLFLPLWFFAVCIAWLSLYSLLSDYRLALTLALLVGELIWIVSWLPIGFLNAGGLCFAVMLFASEAMRENRLRGQNMALLGALAVVIFMVSRWRL